MIFQTEDFIYNLLQQSTECCFWMDVVLVFWWCGNSFPLLSPFQWPTKTGSSALNSPNWPLLPGHDTMSSNWLEIWMTIVQSWDPGELSRQAMCSTVHDSGKWMAFKQKDSLSAWWSTTLLFNKSIYIFGGVSFRNMALLFENVCGDVWSWQV